MRKTEKSRLQKFLRNSCMEFAKRILHQTLRKKKNQTSNSELVTIALAKTSETVFATLINAFKEGPAVSLKESPTVSPTTAALCASLPLPPKFPSSIYFFALSHAPPAVVIEIASRKPDAINPAKSPPRACGPNKNPTS